MIRRALIQTSLTLAYRPYSAITRTILSVHRHHDRALPLLTIRNRLCQPTRHRLWKRPQKPLCFLVRFHFSLATQDVRHLTVTQRQPSVQRWKGKASKKWDPTVPVLTLSLWKALTRKREHFAHFERSSLLANRLRCQLLNLNLPIET